MEQKQNHGNSIVLPSEIELAQVAGYHAVLLEKCKAAGPDAPLMLDLSAGNISAPAMQLLIAARKMLERQSAFACFGPNAGPLLDQTTN